MLGYEELILIFVTFQYFAITADCAVNCVIRTEAKKSSPQSQFFFPELKLRFWRKETTNNSNTRVQVTVHGFYLVPIVTGGCQILMIFLLFYIFLFHRKIPVTPLQNRLSAFCNGLTWILRY